MSVVEEDAVYVGLKHFLRRRGWALLAGQPPSGCDHLPVIEAKATSRTGIGSLGAYKPDLLAYRANVFLLIECKPAQDERDAGKLREILEDNGRIASLFEELEQRHIFSRHSIATDSTHFAAGLRGALAHGGVVSPLCDLLIIRIVATDGSGSISLPTRVDPLLAAALY